MRDLTPAERTIVTLCLDEAANGDYFPDWEFETLIGASRSTVRDAALRFSTGLEISPEMESVALSVLNNLLGYPHAKMDQLERNTRAEGRTILEAFTRLQKSASLD